MRTLVLMRGCPGCGKSTFIKEHNLEPYVLSADQIRLQYCSPILNLEGNYCISQRNDNIVWDKLFEMLEYRMELGCFTIIDATNSKTSEMQRYKDLCQKYRYRIYCIDMTDIPIEVCKVRNNTREPYRRVPEEVIDNIYSRFATQKIPGGIKVIKPSEFDEVMRFNPIDLSEYDNVYVIGDTHGCFTTFQQFNNDIVNHNGENNFFIFCGDYSDRGTENAEMLKFLYGIKDNKNVLLLEGNHDKNINKWGNDDITSIRSKEFLNYTMPELDYKRIFTKKMARELYRKLAQCAYFTYGNETFFVCHGGLSSIPDNLIYIPTRQMIDGVGKYSDYKEMADNYAKYNDIVLINGHRNINKLNTKVNNKCYNLEGAVEFGGNLRVLRIGKNLEKEVLEYSNKLPIAEHLVKQKTEFTDTKTENVIINDNNDNDIGKLVHELRNNKYIIEKQFGNISSFNFSREAFEKGIWDDMTVKARGLYIDTVNNRIQSRGYEKFFRVNEVEETKLPTLARTFKFPIDIFQKENGYLGLISYDYYNDDLFFTTKSTPDGDYSINFKNLFYSKVSEENRDHLKVYLKDNNYTLAVEVIDPVFDPHIIEYSKSKIVGLDLIKNTLNFEVADYMMLGLVCNQIGIDCKKKIGTLNNWEEFEDFYNNAPKDSALYSAYPVYNEDIEGWVLKDSNGFMVKIKSDYYNMWKKLRGVAGAVIKSGNYKYTGALQNPTENYFFAWIKENWELYHYNDTLPRDIITLRKEFYNSRYGELVKK